MIKNLIHCLRHLTYGILCRSKLLLNLDETARIVTGTSAKDIFLIEEIINKKTIDDQISTKRKLLRFKFYFFKQ